VKALLRDETLDASQIAVALDDAHERTAPATFRAKDPPVDAGEGKVKEQS